jgi:hypothetical protein
MGPIPESLTVNIIALATQTFGCSNTHHFRSTSQLTAGHDLFVYRYNKEDIKANTVGDDHESLKPDGYCCNKQLVIN